MERADERQAREILRHQGIDPHAGAPDDQQGGGNDDDDANAALQNLMMCCPMQMKTDRTEREQHREKVTMQIEETVNQPVEVRAAHCHRQLRLE